MICSKALGSGRESVVAGNWEQRKKKKTGGKKEGDMGERIRSTMIKVKKKRLCGIHN